MTPCPTAGKGIAVHSGNSGFHDEPIVTRRLLSTLILLLAILSAPSGGSQGAEPPQPRVAGAGAPVPQVEVGVWLSGLHDVDFLNGSFQAELYLWWIGDDPDFRPFDKLQVLNGRNWSNRAVDSQQLDDGRFYTAGFLSVTVSHNWDLLYYPFDRQTLDVVIETPYTSEQLRFVPQSERSVVGEFVEIEGFRVEDLRISERVSSYGTDFGLDSEAGTHFSRLVIEILVKRESGRIVLAILVGFIVANIISLLTFAIDTVHLGIRASMVGSAVFAAIGNMYLLNSQLHPAVGSMLVDRFAIGTFCVILVALLSGILIDAMVRRNRPGLAHWINRGTCAIVLLAAGTFYVITFQSAMRAG